MAQTRYVKYFNSATAIDTTNEFNEIEILEAAIFSSLQEAKEPALILAPGIMTGSGIGPVTMHSKERFHNIQLESGFIRAWSLVELV